MAGGLRNGRGRAGRQLAAALLLAAGLAPAAARAEVRALLIGADDYLHIDADLRGPGNDVRLMAGVLIGRGVAADALTILTTRPGDLPEGAASGSPDLAGITAAMEAVAQASAPGDTVVFYFSGHGSQTPDLNGDEGGGADEVLLPVDAQGWDGSGLRNVLTDDALGAWAAGLLARGVRVVGLIDACHSDTGFRATPRGLARGLPPEILGVPALAEAEGAGTGPAEALSGEFVFLYSSQSDQRSFEFPLGEDGPWHGAFTLALSQVLAEAPGASWGQVLAAASDRMTRGEAPQLPDGEGPLLSAPVFGTGAGRMRLAVTGDRLQGGLLQGLSAGDTLAFYASAAGGDPLGEARIAKADAASARLDAPAPAGATWAELAVPAPPPPLRLAAPLRADPGDGLDYAAWTGALAAHPVADGPADLVPVLVGGGLALAGPDGALDPSGPGSTPRVTPDAGESPAAALDRVLDAAAHAQRLRAALIGAAGRSLTGAPPLEVAIARRAGRAEGAACTDPAVEGPSPADPAQGVFPCDELWLTVTNRSGRPQDVSALYFAADFSITPIWPRLGLSNRLAPGETARIGLRIDPASPPAVEDLLIVAVPGDPEGPRTDLTVLASPQMTRSTRGADTPLAVWIDSSLGDMAGTRGFSGRAPAYTLVRQAVRVRPGPPADERE